VGAISCITNKAAGLSKELLSHEDVTQTGKKVEATFSSLIKTLLPTL
jgi:purine-nucleoside phosphorylase